MPFAESVHAAESRWSEGQRPRADPTTPLTLNQFICHLAGGVKRSEIPREFVKYWFVLYICHRMSEGHTFEGVAIVSNFMPNLVECSPSPVSITAQSHRCGAGPCDSVSALANHKLRAPESELAANMAWL